MIDQPETAPSARWIVLTPSVDDAHWRAAIAAAVAARGLHLVTDPAFEATSPAHSNLVFLVTDAAFASGAPAHRIAVLMPDPRSCALACASMYGLSSPDDLRHASVLLANASKLARAAKAFPPHTLVAGRSITIFEDLVVVAPPRLPINDVHEVAGEALSIYDGGWPKVGANAVWSPNLFAYDRKAAEAGRKGEPFDITGRPRTLIYGPYLTLPPGRWSATIRFAVDDDAAVRRFRLDWGAGLDYTMSLVHPAGAGIYEMNLEHAFDSEEGAQMRILLMEGAFSGHLAFHGGSITRLPEPVGGSTHEV